MIKKIYTIKNFQPIEYTSIYNQARIINDKIYELFDFENNTVYTYLKLNKDYSFDYQSSYQFLNYLNGRNRIMYGFKDDEILNKLLKRIERLDIEQSLCYNTNQQKQKRKM